ncbi:hypothetical protein JTE90_023444 [Oedothorax gibbosus]|uniref:DDE Tnp4 domain-containing protein n=1 Tax=Oedothorax gibbosus TaxID=931172 RepID=A0AAV6U0J3_9ARAC|nr:hypothetical protein JTE90_023444 [Oedothorax gibbosus]
MTSCTVNSFAKDFGSSVTLARLHPCGLRRKMIAQRIRSTYFLIGDSGYPLEPWLPKPYVAPQTRQEVRFNEKLVRLNV